MESHPDKQEKQLNERLKGFARRILDNDLLATAVIHRNNKAAPRDEGWEHFGGEPSLMLNKDGKIVAGIQLGYEHRTPAGSARKYIYTDFFIVDPNGGENALSEELQVITDGMNPPESQLLIEEAWQLWLTEMHDMMARANRVFSGPNTIAIGDTDLVKLFVNRFTGEIGPGYNMPPGSAVEITLPPLGQPFRN